MCTLEKRRNLFILTLTGGGAEEHRLSPTLIASIRSALHQLKSASATATATGTALITVAEGKFFCNGFDFPWMISASQGSRSEAVTLLRLMVKQFKELVSDLISLPMPTVAAVTGHAAAAAAGLMLAMSHDYVVMRRDRGVLYMPEVDLGITLPDYFAALIRSKVGRADARREVVLRGLKVKAEEAVAMGLIDSAHDSAVEAAVRRGEELAGRNWDGEVYAEIRKGMYPELIGVLGLATKSVVKARL